MRCLSSRKLASWQAIVTFFAGLVDALDTITEDGTAYIVSSPEGVATITSTIASTSTQAMTTGSDLMQIGTEPLSDDVSPGATLEDEAVASRLLDPAFVSDFCSEKAAQTDWEDKPDGYFEHCEVDGRVFVLFRGATTVLTAIPTTFATDGGAPQTISTLDPKEQEGRSSAEVGESESAGGPGSASEPSADTGDSIIEEEDTESGSSSAGSPDRSSDTNTASQMRAGPEGIDSTAEASDSGSLVSSAEEGVGAILTQTSTYFEEGLDNSAALSRWGISGGLPTRTRMISMVLSVIWYLCLCGTW